MTKRFDEAMRLMRRRNGQDRESGFALLRPHAAEHLDELVEAFRAFKAEEDDRRLRAGLPEGLRRLDTKEARIALYRHRTNNAHN